MSVKYGLAYGFVQNTILGLGLKSTTALKLYDDLSKPDTDVRSKYA